MQICHVTMQHDIQCGLAVEIRMRTRFTDPVINAIHMTEDNFQALIDIQDVTHPFKRIAINVCWICTATVLV